MSPPLLPRVPSGHQRYTAVLMTGLVMLAGATLSMPAAAAPSTKTTWTATLPSLSSGAKWTVSVGVYNAQGTLVRKLTTGVSLAAGTYTGTWDGRNDAGLVLPAGPSVQYQFRLVRSALDYVWEGVIGNTSSSFAPGRLG